MHVRGAGRPLPVPPRAADPPPGATLPHGLGATAYLAAATFLAGSALACGTGMSAWVCLKHSSTTSERVGCECTAYLMSYTFSPCATALDTSWMRSAAWRPKMWAPRISPVSWR